MQYKASGGGPGPYASHCDAGSNRHSFTRPPRQHQEQPKFKTGDWVSPTAEVNVRNAPGGTIVGTHAPGDLGIVVSGPETAPLPQKADVNWYLIDWTTAPVSGHTGDDDLAKAAAPPQPTPTPTPPNPTPTPAVTWKEWTNKLNADISKWIEAHPPYPDGE